MLNKKNNINLKYKQIIERMYCIILEWMEYKKVKKIIIKVKNIIEKNV